MTKYETSVERMDNRYGFAHYYVEVGNDDRYCNYVMMVDPVTGEIYGGDPVEGKQTEELDNVCRTVLAEAIAKGKF